MSIGNPPTDARLGVLVANFGGPRQASELVPFLSRLLADVLPGPSWVSGPAGKLLARLRAPKVRPNYEAIGWSPLIETHERQMDLLRPQVDLPLASGMMFTPPEFEDGLRELVGSGVDRFLVVPMFPHYSFATTQAAYEMVWQAAGRVGLQDRPFHWVAAYPTHPAYIEALANTIRAGLDQLDDPAGAHLLFSPHGLPVSFVERGDPYPDQIRSSVSAVLEHLGWKGPWHLGWQSRVGPVEWLSPSTPDELQRLGAEGVKKVVVVPLSFVSEHIETLDEIDREFRHVAESAGIEQFVRAPALNEDAAFIRCLAELVRAASSAFDTYHCVRCLEVKTRAHRDRKSCPECRFVTPAFLRESR